MCLVAASTLVCLRLGIDKFEFTPVLLVFFGVSVCFLGQWLLEERKAYRRDLLFAREKPLPRGLLSVSEVSSVIGFSWGMMIVFGLSLFAADPAAGICYGLAVLHCGLGFLGRDLGRSVQFILLCAFAIGVSHPELLAFSI